MTSTTTKLSVIILYQQEDRLLKQAVASAQFADQIITVKNKEIADFAKVRNQTLKKAKHEWVFFLDSDETINPNSIAEIKHIIQQNRVDGVMINRRDIFYNQPLHHGEARWTQLLRMGKKTTLTWERPVHEIARVDGLVQVSGIKIDHFAHPSLSEFINKIIQYSQIEANYRLKNKNPIRNTELITFPVGKFIYNYIFKLGCLDGWRGLSYALIMSLHSLSVRVLLYEKQKS